MRCLITDFGASPSETQNNASAIQAAIDAVSKAGGGTVVIPSGRFLTSTLRFCSHLTLEVESGATLAAWPQVEDYPVHADQDHPDHDGRVLLLIHEVESVSITGPGTLDGQGPCFWEPIPGPGKWIPEKKPRVSPLLSIRNVREFRLTDIRIINSPGWTVHMHACDQVWVRGIQIDNHLFGPNTDGLDIDGCRDVCVSDCQISCGDDCIVLKTTRQSRSCERVTVTNCVLRTNCVPLKLGTESWHDFRHILFSNCVCTRSTRMVGLYAFDGGTMEQISISHIVGDTDVDFVLNRPLQIMVQKRTPESAVSTLRDVTLTDLNAKTDGRVFLTCIDGCRAERIRIRGLTLSYDRIDDPDCEESRISKSLHHPVRAQEACTARAAIVAKGLTDLDIQDVHLNWPESPGVPMGTFWGQDLQGGTVDLTTCSPVPGAEAVIMDRCSMEQVRKPQV